MLKALWRAFVYGPIDNDEKVASKKNIPDLRLECKNHTLFETKVIKIKSLFLTLGPHIFV